MQQGDDAGDSRAIHRCRDRLPMPTTNRQTFMPPMHSTVQAIYDAYAKTKNEPPRTHLGASLIGKTCDRELWYGFRWVKTIVHDGRLLRLFGTGHAAEPRFIADLKSIGCEVISHDETGEQIRVHDHGGHFGGSTDGVVRGVPEAPKTWHVAEFKTHSESSFKKLQKDGVKLAKPQHFAQMQVYMGYLQLERALYLAVNKNTDELYAERVEFDAAAFAKLKAKALRIIEAETPPMRAHQDPSHFDCKHCDFSDICWGSTRPEVNCRTCAHSTPVVDGGSEANWRCSVHNGHVPVDFQRTGCDGHRYIPIFLESSNARQVGYEDGVVIYEVNGATFGNGDGTGGTFSSKEIKDVGAVEMLPEMVQVKRDFSTAKVVG